MLKKLSNLALSLVVIFCAAAMLPSKASATVYRTGTSSYASATVSGYTMGAYATRGSNFGTATTTFGTTAGLTAHVRVDYNIPQRGLSASYFIEKKAMDSGTTVTAIAYCPSYAIAKTTYGGHDLSYMSSPRHLETQA